MFEIKQNPEGAIIMSGRLDAAQAPRAQEFLDRFGDDCIVDMQQLDYISSAGLGVLLKTHKRLMTSGQSLRLVNVNEHINTIFGYSGFDRLFEITPA